LIQVNREVKRRTWEEVGEGKYSQNAVHRKKKIYCRAVVAHAFNPSTWEAEAGGFLSSRPAWSTE
jgi:major histocompatibility complex class I